MLPAIEAPSRLLKVNPSRWKANDTVQIGFLIVNDSSRWTTSTIGISIPGSQISLKENSDEFLWVPDTSILARDNPYALVKSGFLTASRDTEFLSNFKYWILEDPAGYYYFFEDSSYFRLDTVPQLSFKELMQRK